MGSIGPTETLRILLIAEREPLREQIGSILTEYAGDHRLFWVAQPELAARRTQDLLPHLVLVDDELAGVQAAQVVKSLIAAVPGVSVLALVDEQGMGVARQSVLSGARGFVTKPLQPDDFWATLYHVLMQQYSSAREPQPVQSTGGRVVVFVGPKGGTGRSNVAVNSALAVHKATGQSVVLIDADYSAPALDVLLNIQEDKDISHILARIARLDEDLMESVLINHSSGVRVLLAPPPANAALEISLPQVQQIVTMLKQMFDWVVVDLGLPLDEPACGFLDCADRIIVNVLPEMVGLRNTRLMLDHFHNRGYAEEKIWLVINRASMTGGIARRDIEERLHVRVRHTIPDDQPLVSMAVNRGVPLIMSHERSAVGKAMKELATLMINDAKGERDPAAVVAATLHALTNPVQRVFHRVRSVESRSA